ncbi:succinate dehydrogenase, hydrophobic membrane anchor protein [Sphingomonas solaris]|uniref:Succinate dehydrogenase hydrophobic membrane anchor subunit n=1 Tax=Alterirhizorhabdus solaris TaxID=2529389 RepID=A0A558R6Q3_9SPHN|nr:succinate dehydrogenase, hydrophobic membrane anchor protein [Sphingomonas solaris]TVV75063.1 succinate dehydrogenase, hydrophobic membrane anchor protein [Sphingomonas solaris]
MGTGTGIGRVRGLGSARHGGLHWWHQRLTAAGNLILVLWFVISLFRLPLHDFPTILQWMSSPFVAVGLVLMTVSVFWHLKIGLQVFIEDYVHDDALRVAALMALNFYAVGGGALAIFSILKIALLGVKG